MMISTLTASSLVPYPASQTSSPAQLFTILSQAPPPNLLLEGTSQTPLLTHYFTGANALETGSAEQTIFFSIPSTIRNLLGKEAQEIKESVESCLPKLSGAQILKRAFREFYSREQVHVFEFLDAPISSRQTVSQALTIVKRFSRADYSATKVKIKDLVLDLSANSVVQDIQSEFSGEGPYSYTTWIQQTRSVLERWKMAATEFAAAEKKLDSHLAVFQDLQKRVQMVLGLPLGDGYEGVLVAMEAYLKAQFEEHRLEPAYKDYLLALKKLIVFSDAMSSVRALVNTPVEPLCPICFTEAITVAYEPCGHTICNQCSTRQGTTCAVCRTPIRDRLKLYFS